MKKNTFILKGILLICLIGYPFKSLANPLIQEIAPEISESFSRVAFLGGIITIILLAIVLAMCGVFAIPKAIRNGWSGIKWLLFDTIFFIAILITLVVFILIIFVEKDAGLIFLPVYIAVLLLMAAVPGSYIIIGLIFILYDFFLSPIIYLFNKVWGKIVHYSDHSAIFFRKKGGD